MIPKKIHDCWFGGNPLNDMGKKCIESWKKYLPDYEIIEWNESNFDINCCDYVREAYEAKKWAFVSDYARFKILYENGGVYFDTDVELIKPIDDIIERGSFMGCECKYFDTLTSPAKLGVNPGLGIAAPAGHEFYAQIIERYHTFHFLNENGTHNLKTIVQYTSELLTEHGLKLTDDIQFVCGIYVYPYDYFNPKDFDSGIIEKTANTRSIHHYVASWAPRASVYRGKIYQFLTRTFGKEAAEAVRSLFGRKK